MMPFVLIGGSALAVYLLMRPERADAATTPAGAAVPQPLVPVSIAISVPATAAPSTTHQPAPSPNQPPPQITTVPAPAWPGEIAKPKPPAVQLTGRWGWPVPRWQGRAAVISDGFGSPRPAPYQTHKGVDIMFARITSDPFPLGPNATKAFVMPSNWMAVAASDGVLWSAGKSPRGYSVVVDHGNVATFYQHLELLLVPETKPPAGAPRTTLIPIKAGQPLGVIGGDPLEASHLRHLHFELWAGGPQNAIDPAPLMKGWQVFGPDDVAPFLHAAPRNARGKVPGKTRSLGASNDDGLLVHVTDYWRALPGLGGKRR